MLTCQLLGNLVIYSCGSNGKWTINCNPRNFSMRKKFRTLAFSNFRMLLISYHKDGVTHSLGWNWVADVTGCQFDRVWLQKNAAQTPSDCGVGPEQELFPFGPCNANPLHASSASLKHGLPTSSFFEWSSLLAHRLAVITHAIVKVRCKKETVQSWQQSTRKGPRPCSRFPFL